MATTRRTLLLTALASAAWPQDRLPPTDQSSADPTFAAFLDELRAVIKRRDARALLVHIAPDVHISFGPSKGIEDFRKYWQLDKPASSTIWPTLSEILRLGCHHDPATNTFTAPYLFRGLPSQFAHDEYVVTVTANARMYARPDAAAPVVRTLDWDILKIVDRAGLWYGVPGPNGQTAWVRTGDVRAPLDYRAGFEKRNNRWLLVVLVSGD